MKHELLGFRMTYKEMASSSKIALSGKSLPELTQFVTELGEPSFRARQLFSWIYSKRASSFDQMTDLSQEVREKLKQTAQIELLEIAHLQISRDGTRKYLFKLPDGALVESVLMSFDDRDTFSACVSSQVGCAVGCTFCATGHMGFIRNLTAAEIVDQVMGIQRDSGARVANVVYMGQGEPLLNVEEVIKSIRALGESVGIGSRHITVSTSGVVPGINRLAQEHLQITLALSLHAPDQQTREQLVPIARKWELPELIRALHNYSQATGRRVTIEYLLLSGLTDTAEKARALAELVRDLHCNINLIPLNPVQTISGQIPFSRPTLVRQRHFQELSGRSGKTVTIRLERGGDIDAACGQLHSLFSQQPQ